MPASRPIAERLKEKTKVSAERSWSGIPCHEWTGYLMPNGYGQAHYAGRTVLVHRIAWELANGPVDGGLYVLHRCDNRRCVNISHLFLGSFDDNMADMVAKSRQAHGERNGHAKLTEQDVLAIRASSDLHADLAKRYGVSQGHVSEIRSHKTWRIIGKI